ncbi:MAG: Ig-like domain-containing protein [Bacteroidales bacterium]
MKKIALLIPIAFLISLFFPRCAIQVAPTGGPMDTIAPILINSKPSMHATQFKGKSISLTFDEYIKLEKISEKLVLSPPQEQLPEFKIRGKGIDIIFAESLADSTTYTLYFADAIVDNNEGNKMENFEFAFSTGHEIDSLRVQGKIVDAFDKKPREGVFVMLYDSFNDSTPIKERPQYVTKTNKSGFFRLSNLKQNNYKIFALADGNSNYKFDQISEEIAFREQPIDTSMLLTPTQANATRDTLLVLSMFKEENKAIVLTDFNRPQRRLLKFGFTKPLTDTLIVTPLNVSFDTTKQWFINGYSPSLDTINFWITDSVISQIDTLVVKAIYSKTDSVLNLVQTKDTLRMFFQDKSTTTSKRKQKEDENEAAQKPVLNIKLSVGKGESIPPTQKLYLNFNIPLLSIDTSLISIFNLTDSVYLPNIVPKPDTLNPTQYEIKQLWTSKTPYRFTALPGAFVNLDGLTNDTLLVAFAGADPDKYGTIKVALTNVKPNVIAELLDGKGNVVDSKIITSDTLTTFTYVKPANYSMRFIEDKNRNGKWDTGSYLNCIQPENVYIYQDDNKNKEIQVRANWEYELKYKLKSKEDVSSDELRDVPNTKGE